MKRYYYKVVLNGTDVNPFLRLGVTQNPFPPYAKYEHAMLNRKLNELAAGPIRNVEHLREILKDSTEQFREGCVARFRPGEKTEFTIYFDE